MGEQLRHGGALLHRNKRVVTVVYGVVCAGCVCAACPCCFVRGPNAKVHQKFGKPRHIGDRQKARDETSQTITFN